MKRTDGMMGLCQHSSSNHKVGSVQETQVLPEKRKIVYKEKGDE
jgi:hypothetical protein